MRGSGASGPPHTPTHGARRWAGGGAQGGRALWLNCGVALVAVVELRCPASSIRTYARSSVLCVQQQLLK